MGTPRLSCSPRGSSLVRGRMLSRGEPLLDGLLTVLEPGPGHPGAVAHRTPRPAGDRLGARRPTRAHRGLQPAAGSTSPDAPPEARPDSVRGQSGRPRQGARCCSDAGLGGMDPGLDAPGAIEPRRGPCASSPSPRNRRAVRPRTLRCGAAPGQICTGELRGSHPIRPSILAPHLRTLRTARSDARRGSRAPFRTRGPPPPW